MGKFSGMRDPLWQSGNVISYMIFPYFSIGLKLNIERVY
jgi:hypothetical protein